MVVHVLLKNITALVWTFHSLSYYLLLQCWDGQPEERPNFRQLVVTIAAMLEEVSGYLSLNIIEKRILAPDTHLLYYNLGTTGQP